MSSSSSSSISSSAAVTKKLRKRELKKVEDDRSREITFSKRRKGLFGKASELSLLCGAEIAVVAYSPHGNPFAFSTTGSPDDILGRLSSGVAPPSLRFWWEDPIDDSLVETDLEKYIGRMEALREKVVQRLESSTVESPNSEAFESCSFGGMTVVDTETAIPDCSSAPDMRDEIWEELGMEEIAEMWEELGMIDFTSAHVSDSPALEWTDADVDDMFESTISGWPDEEIDAMLLDWGIEAPSLDFLPDDGMRYCSVL